MIFLKKMAGRAVIRLNLAQLGHYFPTDVHRMWTARMENAAGRWIEQERWQARDAAALLLLFQRGQRGDERLSVRMERSLINILNSANFDQFSGVHNANSI